MNNFEEVLQKCEKNINYYSSYISRRTSNDFDDARQDILERMLKASSKYDPSISGIKTYYINVIKNHVKREIYREIVNKKKNQCVDNIVNLPKYKRNPDSFKVAEEMDIIPDEDLRNDFLRKTEEIEMLDYIEGKLEGTSKEIFRLMRYYSTDLDDLKKVLKTTKGNICNIIRRHIRPIVKKLFKRYYYE